MATAAYTLSMPQKEAFDYTLKALQDAQALIGTQVPPERIEFALNQTDKMAGSLVIPMNGHVVTAKLKDGQTNATLTIGPSMQYTVYAVAIAAIAILIGNLLLGSLGSIVSALVAVALAYALWVLFAKLPQDALDVLGGKLNASNRVVGGGPAAPDDVIRPEQPKPAPKPKPDEAKAETTAKTVTVKADEAKVLVTPPQQQPKQIEGPHDTAQRPAA
ncbi:MAG TPA: hypothetical protein VG387_00970 [Rhizomicrobium sp.]|jgi:hypothetical protein|nr:hypothetical protein [Rhizomicrobium sp.]